MVMECQVSEMGGNISFLTSFTLTVSIIIKLTTKQTHRNFPAQVREQRHQGLQSSHGQQGGGGGDRQVQHRAARRPGGVSPPGEAELQQSREVRMVNNVDSFYHKDIKLIC